MREEDMDEFSELLDGVCGLLSRGKYVPSPINTALFFRALARHSMDDVRAAFDAHIADTQRGQYVPSPADILAQIEGLAANDGRPGVEEAWGLCARACDESETIVWTEEMAQAWLVSREVMAMGDRVGARMAFKESYTRQVEDARRIRRPISWTVSMGKDPAKRLSALSKAETMGLLGVGEALRLAPPEAGSDAFALLLENAVKREEISDPAEIRRRAQELKDRLIKPVDHDPAPDVRAQERLQAAKLDASKKVADYLERGGEA